MKRDGTVSPFNTPPTRRPGKCFTFVLGALCDVGGVLLFVRRACVTASATAEGSREVSYAHGSACEDYCAMPLFIWAKRGEPATSIVRVEEEAEFGGKW